MSDQFSRLFAIVKPVTADNFGLVIAYLLPGFVTLWGLQPFVPTVVVWLGNSSVAAPSVGGFFYATLGATAAGLLVSTIRWAAIDTLYHHTGIPVPDWDFGNLPAKLSAFESHVQDHYRYYQFHANLLVAALIAYGFRLVAESRWPGQGGWEDVAVGIVVVLLVAGSRDNMRKYYRRTEALLPRTHQSGRFDEDVESVQIGGHPTSTPKPKPAKPKPGR